MAETMRALVIDRTGGPDELHVGDVPRPLRISDEVLVRVVTAAVNPIDAKTRAGRGVAAAIGAFPAVLGNDFAGVVEAVPYAAHPLQPGDRVYGMGRVPRLSGTYAEFVSVSSMSLAPMPASLGFADAAGVPLAALTAWGAVIDTARAHEGQRMLVHAAAGGVGHFAVQLAAYFGAEVTATCSERNVDFVRSLGARHVVDYAARAVRGRRRRPGRGDRPRRQRRGRHGHPLARRAATARARGERAERVVADDGRGGGGPRHPGHRVLGLARRPHARGDHPAHRRRFAARARRSRVRRSPTAQRRTACSRRGTCAASSCCAWHPTRSSGARPDPGARHWARPVRGVRMLRSPFRADSPCSPSTSAGDSSSTACGFPMHFPHLYSLITGCFCP